MKKLILALAAGLLACLPLDTAVAANMIVRDGQNVLHTVCSQLKSGIDYPCQLAYGQRPDGTYGPILTDSLGNQISGSFKLQSGKSVSVTTSSTPTALPTGSTVLLTNSGAQDVYFAQGGSTVTVTAGSSAAVLRAGRSLAISAEPGAYIATATLSSTSTLDILGGQGQPAISGGGGSGSGGTSDATAANQTAVQATAGSDASKAMAVQGITGGKAVTVDGSAVTQPVSVASLPLPSLASTDATVAETHGTKAAGTAATKSELVGAVYNTSLPSLTTGQQAALQADSSGRLYVNCGTGCSGGTQYAEDAAHVSGDVGTLALVVRKDTAAQLAGSDGDYSALITDSSGRLHVNVGTSALPTGAATEASLNRIQGVIGAATAPTYMGLIGGVYVSSAPTLTTGQSYAARLDSHGSLVTTCANADGSLCGDISTVKTDQTTHGTTDLVAADITKVGGTAITAGAGNVSSGSPRFALGFPGGTQYNINIATATTTEIVPLSGSTVTYVLFDTLAANGTGDVTWKYGTGTACGTGTTTIGGVVSLATGLGWVEGNGAAPVMIVPAGKALCLTTSAAVQVSGRVIALQF